MATKQQVIDLSKANPHWTARDLAAHIGCMVEYIHACKRRYGIRFAKGTHRSEDPNSMYRLGSEARRLGFTVERLQQIAALERRA